MTVALVDRQWQERSRGFPKGSVLERSRKVGRLADIPRGRASAVAPLFAPNQACQALLVVTSGCENIGMCGEDAHNHRRNEQKAESASNLGSRRERRGLLLKLFEGRAYHRVLGITNLLRGMKLKEGRGCAGRPVK